MFTPSRELFPFGRTYVCRQSGTELCMAPLTFHPNHVCVYARGFHATGAMLLFAMVWMTLTLGGCVPFGARLK
jgi:hypothetical protein